MHGEGLKADQAQLLAIQPGVAGSGDHPLTLGPTDKVDLAPATDKLVKGRLLGVYGLR